MWMSEEDKSFSLTPTHTHTHIPCCRSHCCPEMSGWQRAAHLLGRHTLSSYVSPPRLQSLRSWNAHTRTHAHTDTSNTQMRRWLVCKYACQTVNKLRKISGWWGGKIRAARRQRRRKRRARYQASWQLFRKRNVLKTEAFKFWLHLALFPEGLLQSKTLDLSPKGGGVGGVGVGAALSRLLIPDLDSQRSQQCHFDGFPTLSHLPVVPLPVGSAVITNWFN